MKNLYLFSLILFLFTAGCQSEFDGDYVAMPDHAEVSRTAMSSSESLETAEPSLKLIKEGRVHFRTDDIKVTRETINAAVDEFDAYISSDREQQRSDRVTATLVMRVPAESFDRFLASATLGVGQFDNKEIEVRDVTEEFVDVEARLRTKKELEVRFVNLLDRANTVTEIVEVERQLGNVRSEIESIEGRLQYLRDRVQFSTLTMSFYKTKPESSYTLSFIDGFKNGWGLFVEFIFLLVNLWPFILIIIGSVVGIKYYRKRRDVIKSAER